MRTNELMVLAIAGGIGLAAACGPLEEARDVSGNFEATYTDNLRIYINDELVAEVESGESETVEWNGETFDAQTVCTEDGTSCPSESFWGTVAIDQPWGSENKLINFVNLDQVIGTAGVRLGGVMEDDGSFSMLAGITPGANESCASLLVGTVHGSFNAANTEITDGIIRYEWAAGCSIDGVEIGGKLTLESDFTATRISDLDLSSVTPDEPIDEEGEPIDPEVVE
jgi:hypothetical protein